MSQLKNARPEPQTRPIVEASDDAIRYTISGMNWSEVHDVYFSLPRERRRRLRDEFINLTVMSHDMFMDMYEEIKADESTLCHALSAVTMRSPLLAETDIVDHLVKQGWFNADYACDLALRMDDQTDPRIANLIAENIRPDDIGHVLSQRTVSEEVLHILHRNSRHGSHDLIPFLHQKHIPFPMFKNVIDTLVTKNHNETIIQAIQENPRIALDVWKATDDPCIRSAAADHIDVLELFE